MGFCRNLIGLLGAVGVRTKPEGINWTGGARAFCHKFMGAAHTLYAVLADNLHGFAALSQPVWVQPALAVGIPLVTKHLAPAIATD